MGSVTILNICVQKYGRNKKRFSPRPMENIFPASAENNDKPTDQSTERPTDEPANTYGYDGL